MALLNFPPNPYPGEQYPLFPFVGQNVYIWSAPTDTWVLIGSATGVFPGVYGGPLTIPQITVDVTGSITLATNVPIQQSSLTQLGVVQLNDSINSTSITEAATPSAVKIAYDLADAAVKSVSGTFPITVDNSDPQNPIVEINPASLTDPGAVQLNNSVNSNSVTEAATPSAVKAAYDAALNSVQTVSGILPITVDNSNPQNPVVDIDLATTTAPGAVQLVDDTVTNDPTKALTAAAGYNLQLQIDALNERNNLTFAGTIDATTGSMLTVTTEGAAKGFVSGFPLPPASPANQEYFVIVTVPGTFTPTGGTPQACNDGDWFISDGTQWVYFDVGPTPVTQPSFIFLDNISGGFNGSNKIFTLTRGGVPFVPNPVSNLLLFVGGVPQLIGPSFTLAGSVITFDEAPQTGASFIGLTIAV